MYAMTSVGGSKRKRQWPVGGGPPGSNASGAGRLSAPVSVGAASSSSSSSPSPCASLFVAALSASEKSAAPLRRHLSSRGAMSSLLLLGGGEAAVVKDGASVVEVSAALKRVSGRSIAQLMSALHDEVQSKRNVAAVLRFVHWMLSVRFNEGSRNVLVLGVDEHWIPCLAFMLGYDALVFRVEKLRSQGTRDVNDDGIVSSSVALIERARCMDSRYGGEDMPQTVVERCFGARLSHFHRLVAELEEEDAADQEDMVDDHPKTSSSPATSPPVDFEKDVWEGVDFDLLSSEEECGVEAERGESIGEETVVTDDSKTLGDALDKQNNAKEELVGIGDSDSKARSSDASGDAGADKWMTIERSALGLRAELLEVPPGATSADIQTYADRISNLVRQAGTERGADGVAAIGSTLRGNVTSSFSSNTALESTASPLTDVLIQQLYKTCIDGSTSAIRTAAFIRSFVLPLALRLGTDAGDAGRKKKASTPSRILAVTITSLAKERPLETVNALFIPMIVGSGQGSDTEETEPNQTQADLVSKTIKTGQLPEEAVSQFVVGLIEDKVTPPMIWNDSTMPVLTTLLSKRPSLSDEAVKMLAVLIGKKTKEHCKNSKFSTLFHTLVTKNGALVQQAGCVEELTASANELKTFMGKSIKTALKKLSKSK